MSKFEKENYFTFPRVSGVMREKGEKGGVSYIWPVFILSSGATVTCPSVSPAALGDGLQIDTDTEASYWAFSGKGKRFS